MPKTSGNGMEVCYIKGSSIGDLFTGVPTMRTLKRVGARVTLIHSYRGGAASVLPECEYVDEVALVPESKLKAIGAIRKLRKTNFDVVFDGFPATRKSSALAAALKAGIKVGHTHPEIGNPLTRAYDKTVDAGGLDAVELEMEMLRAIDVPVEKGDDNLEVFYNYEVDVSEFGVPDKAVGFNFGKDGNFPRTWVNEKWADVVSRLAGEYTPVFFGGANNAKTAADIEKKAGVPAVNLVGKTDLRETTALIAKCSSFLTVNSGPMHIAAALGVPVVALNGPSFPQWNPHGRAVNLGGRSLCHKKCTDNRCEYGDARCVKNIEPEDVMKAFRSLL